MRDEFTEKNYLIVEYEEPFNKLIDKVIFNFSSGNLSQEWKVLETLKLKTRDEIPSVISILKRYLLSSNREHKASLADLTIMLH